MGLKDKTKFTREATSARSFPLSAETISETDGEEEPSGQSSSEESEESSSSSEQDLISQSSSQIAETPQSPRALQEWTVSLSSANGTGSSTKKSKSLNRVADHANTNENRRQINGNEIIRHAPTCEASHSPMLVNCGLIYCCRIPRKSPEPVREYKPPDEFKNALVPSTTTKLQYFFSKPQLEGKQIWYLTLPSSVPIDKMTEIPLGSLSTMDPVLSHNGSNYGVVQEAEDKGCNRQLLMAVNGGSEYMIMRSQIVSRIHLRQSAQPLCLPSAATQRSHDTPQLVTSSRASYKKVVRQQPQGLKMRYRPFGDTTGNEELNYCPSSDNENSVLAAPTNSLRPSAKLSKNKRKHPSANEDAAGAKEAPPEKKRKDKSLEASTLAEHSKDKPTNRENLSQSVRPSEQKSSQSEEHDIDAKKSVKGSHGEITKNRSERNKHKKSKDRAKFETT
ncbi:MAG: hypothetical protein MMC33_009417 [Icmadophila ericetorum]|nr:hypothetical protein [Icmadophila ericetorum]